MSLNLIADPSGSSKSAVFEYADVSVIDAAIKGQQHPPPHLTPLLLSSVIFCYLLLSSLLQASPRICILLSVAYFPLIVSLFTMFCMCCTVCANISVC